MKLKTLPQAFHQNYLTLALKFLLILFFAVLCVFYGIWLRPKLRPFFMNYGLAESTSLSGKLALHWISDYIKHYQFFSPVESMYIDLSFKNLQKIRQHREDALKLGMLVTDGTSWVTGNIRNNQEVVEARMRLKGDWVDHISSPTKWSLRIKTHPKERLMGLRIFSIQNPKTRQFLKEPIILECFRKEGILAPRYGFIKSNLNGENQGLMAWEEHFANELLEYHNRPPGPILRFDESLAWKAVPLGTIGFSKAYPKLVGFPGQMAPPYPHFTEQFNEAVVLMRDFMEGRKQTSEVFNLPVLTKFLALIELWGNYHSIDWINLRFYYNPNTHKIEPIVYDASHMGFDWGFHFAEFSREPFLTTVFLDPVVLPKYKEDLKILLERANEIEENAKAVESQYFPILKREFFALEEIDFAHFRWRVTNLKRRESSEKHLDYVLDYPAPIQAFLTKNESSTTLELINLVPHPVKIHAVHSNSLQNFPSINSDMIPILKRAEESEFSTPYRIKLPAVSDPTSFQLVIEAQIIGSDKSYSVPASWYPRLETS